MLSVILLDVVMLKIMAPLVIAECYYTEGRYAECHYTECRYAECHGAKHAPLIHLWNGAYGCIHRDLI
jgi:hypothetical protein